VAVKFAEHRGWIFDALFPRACIRCGGEGAAFCVSCVEAWVPNVLRNRCPFCEQGAVGATCKDCRGKVFLDGLVAVLSYGDPVVRQALTAWKYYGDEAYRDVVMGWMRRFVGQNIFTRDSGTDDMLISPVPLHSYRRRERGFDQAEEIATVVSELLGVSCGQSVARVRMTQPRVRTARGERQVGDLDGIFEALEPVAPHILLCDDVFTSGATMDSAAKALKEAGAKTVLGFAVARG